MRRNAEKKKRGGLFLEEDWEEELLTPSKKRRRDRETPPLDEEEPQGGKVQYDGSEEKEPPQSAGMKKLIIQGEGWRKRDTLPFDGNKPKPWEEEEPGESPPGLFSLERHRKLPAPIEDGKTVILVLQTILCCILVTVLLVVRQGNPQFYEKVERELNQALSSEGSIAADFLEGLRAKGNSFLEQLPFRREDSEAEKDSWEEGGKKAANELGPSETQPEEGESPSYQEENEGPPEELDLNEANELLMSPDAGGKGGGQSVAVAMIKDTASYEAPPWASFSPALFSRKMVLPLDGPTTSPYGYREHPITGELDFHTGVDLAAPEGAPIAAALTGRVEEVGSDEIYGNYILLSHNNIVTKYAHCSEIDAPLGSYVRQGETIAKVGSTGVSTGPHVHFEIHVDGKTVNPAWAFPELEEQE